MLHLSCHDQELLGVIEDYFDPREPKYAPQSCAFSMRRVAIVDYSIRNSFKKITSALSGVFLVCPSLNKQFSDAITCVLQVHC